MVNTDVDTIASDWYIKAVVAGADLMWSSVRGSNLKIQP